MVRGVSLDVGRGEVVGLVGESGSGKTLTALALIGLVPPPGRVTAGGALLAGREPASDPVDLLRLERPRLARGARRAGSASSSRSRRRRSTRSTRSASRSPRRCAPTGRCRAARAREEAARLLDRVALADARRRLDDYPHQFSGGQRQRAMIAMALAGRPDLLLADEPTTALDVTLQAQILELLDELRRDLGLAVLLITHDLGVVAETCDRVVVMHAGRVVETAAVGDLFRAPAHPYTRELLAASPRLGRGGAVTAAAGGGRPAQGVRGAARPAPAPAGHRARAGRRRSRRGAPASAWRWWGSRGAARPPSAAAPCG